MTQDYEPIELNENTPEPTADGIYLLTITMVDETRTYPVMKEGDMWLTDLLSETPQADRVTIQSLVAHDAQIRAEAWEEGRIAEHDEAYGWGDAINPYRKESQQ